ncbi:MAG TPA: hypothetical protein VD968_08865 [Pyrinomonadaceae bacterium]|nr:hypothetical protein [Pyrinomonadaceae bacterium]
MVATAPTKAVQAYGFGRAARKQSGAADAPDLAHFRRRYPLTVASLGSLPRREEWLRRIWERDERWREATETRGGEPVVEEVIVRGAPPRASDAEGEFDLIFAGDGAALLDAAVMARQYGRRVLVLDEPEAAFARRDWNLSEDELRELESSGLFTREEIEAAVLNRRRKGLVKFHDAGSRVKAEPLWVEGVLNVCVDGGRLLALAAEKVRAQGRSAVLPGVRLVRAYVEPDRVTAEVEGPGGARRFFRAEVLVCAGSAASKAARQLNGARSLTHVWPTVGTVARGFARGDSADSVDFRLGEILVSTEDARDHRQLVWQSLAGAPARDECATLLFFYDEVGSPADKSLLSLFERYFEALPAYKRTGAAWRVERPVFDHVPAFRPRGRKARPRVSDDRVMLLGVGSSARGPLAFGGSRTAARGLRSRTHLLSLALEAGLTDAGSLARVCDDRPGVAEAAGLAEFMRPTPEGSPSTVNETLNALMKALGELDERVRRELFQGRMSFVALRRLLARTARLYPRIFARVREHFGARGTLWWAAGIAEAVWSERRARAARHGTPAAWDESPGEKFARHAALYRD